MIAKVSPSLLKGEVCAPASKSAMQRACALALLNKGKTTIINPGVSNDDLTAISIIQNCGASVTSQGDKLLITSDGIVQAPEFLHCGESGLSVRMFTPVVCLGARSTTLTGEGSLVKRPMNVYEKMLPQLGIHVQSHNGFLPMTVKGPLRPADCQMDGSKSSQYVTGVLFALSKAAKKQLHLTVSNLASRPYVDLSLGMLDHFGYKVTNTDYHIFTIDPVEEIQRDISYTTEGDWSGASFLLVGAAIAGFDVVVKGLDVNSSQADKAILNALESCGIQVSNGPKGIQVEQQKNLAPFILDATHCPDLFPPLVALAAFCQGESIIHGTSRLISKESNRLEALTDVFTRMGVHVRSVDDYMIIRGGAGVNGTDVDGHHDHRIVMACAVAALAAKGSVNISGAEAINKSYPDFFKHLLHLGADVSLA